MRVLSRKWWGNNFMLMKCSLALRQDVKLQMPTNPATLDLVKEFDWVPRDLGCWALKELYVGECLVRSVLPIYRNAWSQGRVNDSRSDHFFGAFRTTSGFSVNLSIIQHSVGGVIKGNEVSFPQKWFFILMIGHWLINHVRI